MCRGLAVGLASSAILFGGCGSGGGGGTGGRGGASGGKGGGAAGKGGAGGKAGGGGAAGSGGASGAGARAGAGGAAGAAGSAGAAPAGGASGSRGIAGFDDTAGHVGTGGATDAGVRADAGGTGAPCLGNVTIDFSSRAPYWTDASTACGTATFGSSGLTLTRDGTCTADQQGGVIQLDTTKWQLCGNFDMQVDFDLAQFAVPPNGARWAAWRAQDPAAPANGIALARYNVGDLASCSQSLTMSYESWTSSRVNDCAGELGAETKQVSGTMRLQRRDDQVLSYLTMERDGGVPDAAPPDWVSIQLASHMTLTPWTIVFYTGVWSGDGNAQSVRFSNLVIRSASTP